jgi:hypothetical protein
MLTLPLSSCSLLRKSELLALPSLLLVFFSHKSHALSIVKQCAQAYLVEFGELVNTIIAY